MNYQYKFYLNKKLFDNPIGWDDFTTTLQRKREIGAVLTTVEISAGFIGNGYVFLKRFYDLGLFDEVIRVDIEELRSDSPTYKKIYTGTIFISQSIWTATKCVAKVKIQDNGYYAKINGNQSVEATLSAGVSKLGTSITEADPYILNIHNILNNLSSTKEIYAIRIFEAFRYLFSFIGENSFIFKSDYFDFNGQEQGLCITSGQKLSSTVEDQYKTASVPIPAFSLATLFKEISKVYPIELIVEDHPETPTVRIEKEGYFFSDKVIFRAKNVAEITYKFNENLLYSNYQFGSEILLNDVTSSFPEDITLYGFKDELVPVQIKSNIDKTLDLKGRWVRSSNVIEAALGGDTGYDNDIFLIDSILLYPTFRTSYGITRNTNFLNLVPPRYYFNEELTNYKVSQRLYGAVPSGLAAFLLPENTGTFKAYLSVDRCDINTAGNEFANLDISIESYDIGNNYNPINWKFTAPAGGIFDIAINYHIDITDGGGGGIWTSRLYQHDSAGTPKAIYDVGNFNATTGIDTDGDGTIDTYIPCYVDSHHENFNLGGIQRIVMSKGDSITFDVRMKVGIGGNIETLCILADNTFFSCVYANIGEFKVDTFDPKDYPAFQASCEFPVSIEQFDKIEKNRLGLIEVSDAFGNNFTGFIENLKYDRIKGIAKTELFASIKKAKIIIK